MTGAERIIRTDAGDYCWDCHRDVADPFDRDPEFYVQARLESGTCQCCALQINDGNITDESI